LIWWLLAVAISFILGRWLGPATIGPTCVFFAGVPVLLVYLVIRWRIRDGIARRRTAAGECLSCGYSRAGIQSDAVCPECGKTP
jgi:hypothetical protein